jgi:DNA-binding response OmpR family regulator
VEIDPGSRQVWVDGHELSPPLSAAQFALLHLLYTHANNVVSRDEIARTVWPEAAGAVSEQAIDALVRRLRDRLAEGNPHHQYIVTVRGHGFMLDNRT